MSKPLRHSEPTSLREILEHSAKLKRLGVMDGPGQLEVFRRWEQLAGPAVAANARPVKISHGSLVVAVRSPAWMQQLSLMKPQLMENLKAALGAGAPADLRFTLSETDFLKGDAPR